MVVVDVSGRALARLCRALLVVTALGYVGSVLPGVRPPGQDYVPALDAGLSTVVIALAALCCGVRAVRIRAERLAWGLMATAITTYGLGNVYYYAELVHLPVEQVPYPSAADAGWLLWYLPLVAALLLLVRTRLTGLRFVLWLDGLTVGVGCAAVAGAAVLAPLLAQGTGEPLLVLVNLAYPVADLALLTVVVLVVHLCGWRPDRTWWTVAAAGGLLLLGDSVYLLQLSAGTYVDGTLLDASWTVVCTLLGLAAGDAAPAPREIRLTRTAMAVPAALSLAGTAVLFVGALRPEPQAVVVSVLGLLSVLLASARLLLTLRDTQRLADAQREARTDELTGLPNRRELMDRLARTVRADRRAGTLSAVLLIDLDRFKEVNDTLGHHHGDALLQAVSGRLRGAFRETSTVARLGGDEFAVLLPDVPDRASAERLAARCLTVLEEDFEVEGVALQVEASVGLALSPTHGEDGNALMRAADVAMYEAKAGGRGVVVYQRATDVHTPSRLALLGDLRRALQNDELVLHYQPKVHLGTGLVGGMEALARWQHPVRGLLQPADFIPAAEGTGLIVPLTERTLELAAAAARRWMDDGHAVQVAVNLSPRCLLEPDLPERVRQILARHALPAHLLRLEVTESTVMVDPAGALTTLLALEDLGVGLSIDDFGTGYSSMAYLKRMPVDELKIDRSFVLDMLAGDGDTALVRSSIDLAHNLGMSVVAEGVEDAATLAALSALGCDVVQGYHLARPMPAEAMTAWLDARRPGAVPSPSLPVLDAPPV